MHSGGGHRGGPRGGASKRGGAHHRGHGSTPPNNQFVQCVAQACSGRYANSQLNLSELTNQQSIFNQIQQTIDFNQGDFVKNFMLSVPQEARQAITQIDLSKNGITRLNPYSYLQKNFPNIISVNFSSNNLQDIQELKYLDKLSNIKHMSFQPNPFVTRYSNMQEYATAVKQMLPWLETLDGNPVTSINPSATQNCFQYQPNGISVDDNLLNPVRSFFEKYKSIFDTPQRPGIENAYHENAFFSVTAEIPQGLQYSGGSTDNSDLNEIMTNYGRNMQQVTTESVRTQRLVVGPVSIARSLRIFPQTKHDTNVNVDISSISIPKHSQILVCFHGLIQWGSPNVVRTYNRTWILVPAQGEWPAQIINDQLHLFPRVSIEAIPYSGGQNSQKQMMIQTLANETKMTQKYAELCLSQSNWNLDTARMSFQQSRANLPREAFQ